MKTNDELIEELKAWGWSTEAARQAFTHEQMVKIRDILTQKDADVEEAVNEALLTKTQYAEIAKGWGAEGSDRYEGYIQGAMDVNARVIWSLAGNGIAVDIGLTPLKQPTPDLVSIEDKKQTNLPDHSELDQEDSK